MCPRRTTETARTSEAAISQNPSSFGFSFNYTENFNRITELNSDNYQSWKINMLYLLDINNLIDYVITEKIKKYKKNKVLNNLENYITDKLDNSLVYKNDINPVDIKKDDNVTKWVILNSLGQETRKIVENRGKTAFQTWKILENSFTKSKEQLRIELKSSLDTIKFNPEKDINIFIASLENIFEELEYIDTSIPDDMKVGILNRALPDNLRFINVFQFREDWQRCQDYVLKVIPDIIFSNTKENKISVERQDSIIADNVINTRSPKSHVKQNKRKNGRCYICKKYGHYSNECIYNKLNKSNTINKKKIFKSTKSMKYKKIHNNKRKFNKTKINIKKKFYNNKNHAFSINTNVKSNRSYKDNYINAFTEDYCSNFKNEVNIVECTEKSNITNNFNNKLNEITLWTLDSGASVHITNQLNILTNTKCHVENVIFANGDAIQSKFIGNYEGYINNNKITLSNVLYVPEFTKNLISISKLTKQNFKIIFHFQNSPYVILYDNN
eukprot:jgi/Orpsp1_1/1181777/evm.model.c7180000078571.1